MTRGKKTSSLPAIKGETQTSAELNKKLKSAIRVIDTKLRKLGGGVNREEFRVTNPGSFKYNELDSNTVNIHNLHGAVYFTKALAKMKRIKREYEEIMEELEIKEYPQPLWCNLPVNDLIHDLTIQVKYTINQATIMNLEAAKTELYSFLSNEDKLHSTLTRLSELLK